MSGFEFKDSWFDPGGIGRYASALANSARISGVSRGYLVWGVKNDRMVVGTKLDFRTRVTQNQPFEFWLKGRLTPKGHAFRFHYEEKEDGLRLVALVVEAADRVPVRFEHIAYVRIGSATPALHDHADREERLLAILAATRYEDDPALEHATEDEVFDLVDVYGALEKLRETPASAPADALRQLERNKLLKSTGGGHWTISNVAAILFARSLEAFGLAYARKAPRVVIYPGSSRGRTLREQTGVKGYAIGFDGLADYLDLHVPRSERLRGYTRVDHPLYPMVALRELLANALHQDFFVRGAGPVVEVFDGRIEIANPGAPLVDVDRLIDEPPRSRNERLAYLMRQIGYCEERGSGIDKIVEAAEIYQLPPPHFALKKAGFIGTLYAARDFGQMTATERVRATYQHASLLWASGRTALTNASLRKRFGLPDNPAGQVSRLIGEAVDAGAHSPTSSRTRTGQPPTRPRYERPSQRARRRHDPAGPG